MRKAQRKRYTLFTLAGDPPGTQRKLGHLRLVKVRAYLDRTYGPGRWTLISIPGKQR